MSCTSVPTPSPSSRSPTAPLLLLISASSLRLDAPSAAACTSHPSAGPYTRGHTVTLPPRCPSWHFPAPGRSFPALCLQCSHSLGRGKKGNEPPLCTQSRDGTGGPMPPVGCRGDVQSPGHLSTPQPPPQRIFYSPTAPHNPWGHRARGAAWRWAAFCSLCIFGFFASFSLCSGSFCIFRFFAFVLFASFQLLLLFHLCSFA